MDDLFNEPSDERNLGYLFLDPLGNLLDGTGDPADDRVGDGGRILKDRTIIKRRRIGGEVHLFARKLGAASDIDIHI